MKGAFNNYTLHTIMKYEQARKATYARLTGEDGFDREIQDFDHKRRVYFEKVYLHDDRVYFNMLVYPTKGKGRYFRFISHPTRPADGVRLPYSYEKASDWTTDIFTISCNVYTASGKIVDSFDIVPHLSMFKQVVQDNKIVSMIKIPRMIKDFIGGMLNFCAYRTIETLKTELLIHAPFCEAH